MSKQFNNWASDDKSFLSTILATVVFKCIIQGLLFVAAWRYFANASRDGIKLQTLVGVVLFLEVCVFHISVNETIHCLKRWYAAYTLPFQSQKCIWSLLTTSFG